MTQHFTAKGHLATWVVLMALTTGTLLVSFVMHGRWDVIVALMFAVLKASLVIWIFMHMSEEPPASRVAFATGLFLVLLLLTLVVGDVALRIPLSVQPPETH